MVCKVDSIVLFADLPYASLLGFLVNFSSPKEERYQCEGLKDLEENAFGQAETRVCEVQAPRPTMSLS